MGIDYSKRPSPAASPQPAPAGVNLSKVTLTPSASRVSLVKPTGGSGVLRVNLNWNARPAAATGGGFMKRLAGAVSQGIDLDLGCLYEYADGTKGVVQALGNALTDRHSFGGKPIIWLDGDDRTGSGAGENLYVDLVRAASIRRVLVFAYIYEGTPNWAQADAVVTMFPVVGPQVEVRLDVHDPRSRMCALALLENVGGEMVVTREVKYINGAQDALDRAYHWGLNWKSGRK